MALFELDQHYENQSPEWRTPTFKDCVAADIGLAFLMGMNTPNGIPLTGKKPW